jgi:hypothetical protein
MPAESERGCGYRKVGSLYLVGSGGMPSVCDSLPMKLEPCPHCGFEIPRHEGFMWVSKQYFIPPARNHVSSAARECSCPPTCPMCYPTFNTLPKYGLMWVGTKFYTPESFVKEGLARGISKKISEIPKGLVMGRTWVMLAYRKVPFSQQFKWAEIQEEPVYKPAIFYGFKPERVELPLWKDEATAEQIRELEEQGITPVIFEKTPENLKAHQGNRTKKVRRLMD